MVSGDVLFAGSIGRTDFPGGDFDTLISSITQRLWPMGDDTVFIPGHGPVMKEDHYLRQMIAVLKSIETAASLVRSSNVEQPAYVAPQAG